MAVIHLSDHNLLSWPLQGFMLNGSNADMSSVPYIQFQMHSQSYLIVKKWPIFCHAKLNYMQPVTPATFAPKWWYYISNRLHAEGEDRLPAASGGHLQDCNSLEWIREAFVIVLSHQKSGPACTATFGQFQSLQGGRSVAGDLTGPFNYNINGNNQLNIHEHRQ